jgi:hypothetical protein
LSTVKQAASWIDAERNNLYAAVEYAALHGRPAHAIAIPILMHDFLRTYGHWAQAIALHRITLGAAREAGDSLGEASALIDIGDIQHLTGNYTAAAVSLTGDRGGGTNACGAGRISTSRIAAWVRRRPRPRSGPGADFRGIMMERSTNTSAPAMPCQEESG